MPMYNFINIHFTILCTLHEILRGPLTPRRLPSVYFVFVVL